MWVYVLKESSTFWWCSACKARASPLVGSRRFVAAVTSSMSAEEDDFVFPLEVMRTGARGRAPPAPAVFDATLHGCLAPQGEDDPFNLAAQTAAPRDARGSYDRTGGKGTRSKWLPHVQSHMKVVKTGNLSAYLADPKRACSKNCPQGGKCLEAVGAHL